MSKKSPPKTAFYKVTTSVTGTDGVTTDAVVVEATSWSEAAAFIAAKHIAVEEYPVDKLVAYIKAGGEPIKVPAKAKRPYAKKAAPKPASAAGFSVANSPEPSPTTA